MKRAGVAGDTVLRHRRATMHAMASHPSSPAPLALALASVLCTFIPSAAQAEPAAQASLARESALCWERALAINPLLAREYGPELERPGDGLRAKEGMK